MSDLGFWAVQIPGWLLFGYIVIAQCLSAFSYALGVRMGTQEPAETVTEVGVAFWKGFAGADLLFYGPILGVGLIGNARETIWSDIVLSAALGVTIYWPIACLWAIRAARGATGWRLPKERQYWVVLPAISFWGLFALIVLLFRQ